MIAGDSTGAAETLMPQHLLLRALGGVSQAMVITDASQTIVFVNAAYTAMTGYDEAELVGRNWMLQGPGSDSKTIAQLRSSLAQGEPFRGQILNYRKDGTAFWNALSVSPVRDDDGVVSLFISVQSEVTADVDAPDNLHLPSAGPSQPAQNVPSQTSPDYRNRLLNGGLRMHMQPIVDLRTGAPHFVEALARLEMEDGTLVLPGVFLPLLSESDVTLLFRQALEHVLVQLAEWDRTGLRLDVSINLSPSTLSEPDCARWVADALERHAISPQRLGIELLENKILHDQVQMKTFAELRALGVGLAMDDLGAGYSGLGRLLKLPFQTVKVDVGIVAQVRNRPIPTLAMLTTLIHMGRDHEWDIIIEGLEDAALTEVAAILGAPYGQGFHLCRPIPAQDIAAWLAQLSPVPDPGTVRTPLGALAYHWMLHRTHSPHSTSYETCPITTVLIEHADARAIEWHHAQHHASRGSNAASEKLLAWLAEWSPNE